MITHIHNPQLQPIAVPREIKSLGSDASTSNASTPEAATDQRVPSHPMEVAGLDAARLRDMKQRLQAVHANVKSETDGLATSGLGTASSRFQTGAFGRVVSNGPDRDRLGIGAPASTHSRNPVPGPQMRLTGTQLYSDDPSQESKDKSASGGGAEKSTWEKVKDGVVSVVSSMASTLAGALLGDVGGTAFSVLTANGTPEEKRNEAEGFLGIVRQGRTGTSNAAAAEQLREIGFEPVPDDTQNGGGSTTVTRGMLEDLRKRLGAKGEPQPSDAGGDTGGPINTGVSGTGALGSRVLLSPTSEASSGHAVTALDLEALRVRIDAKITHVR